MTQHEMHSLFARVGKSLFAVFAIAAFVAIIIPGLTGARAEASTSVTAATLQQSTPTKKAAATTPHVAYQVKMNKTGWSEQQLNGKTAGIIANNRRIYSIKASLDVDASAGGIVYQTRMSNGTWKAEKRNGKATSSSKSIDALKIYLTGPIAENYDVVYRVYIEGIGWQRRMRNGEVAGVEYSGKRIEALQISIVAKKKAAGWVWNDGWTFCKKGKPLTNTWLETSEHPIDTALAGKQRYWLDSSGKLAIDRYINPKNPNDAAAAITAYATPQGYVARGKYTNADGLLLANPATGALYTKTRWLTTKTFDGAKRTYRLAKKAGTPVAVVKTGIFKVGKKRYCGWDDGRGYILKSEVCYIGTTWYKANSQGVLLANYNSKTTQHIERYVKWAIKIANDNRHGYSQYSRWGPDYDCSSFVCASLLAVGFPNSGASWTGNMKQCLKTIGFKWHKGTTGIRRGDILLAHNNQNQHTEIYLGNGKNVGAHSSETGGIYGKAGDQTGREISVTNYYNMPWDGYLRYRG